MRYIRNSGRPNLLVGLFLLVLLLVVAGPNTLPRLLPNLIPGADEAIPCAWLRPASDRANHQSLIGRAETSPISLSVRTSGVPQTPDLSLFVTITVTNNSLGTIPFVYNPNQIITGDNGTSGLGLLFDPANSLQTGYTRPPDPASFPESDLRVLQPRQSCVHRVEFPGGNVLIDPAINSGRAEVRAYYRSNSRGQIVIAPNAVATPIYPDQGLIANYYVESAPVLVGLSGQ